MASVDSAEVNFVLRQEQHLYPMEVENQEPKSLPPLGGLRSFIKKNINPG